MWKARHGTEAKKTSELSAKDHSYKEYLGTQVKCRCINRETFNFPDMIERHYF